MNIKTRIELNHLEAAEIVKAHFAAKNEGEVEVEILLPPNFVPDPSPANLAKIREGATLNFEGYRNKITLIKEIRTMFGWGLKESKDFVEAFYP